MYRDMYDSGETLYEDYLSRFNSGTETFLKYSWIPSDIAEAMFTGDSAIM